MKTLLRVLGGPLCVGLMMLFTLTPAANASTVRSAPLLPRSPLSGGLQMAQAIHNGTIHLPTHQGSAHSANPNLTCTPAPCALPNVQASGNGTNIANEDPIAVNPNNGQDMLSGANDYNCASLQGFYSSTNGGSTWRSTCMNTLSGAFGDGDPGVGYDLQGNSYISGIDGGTSPDGYDIVFEKSSNNGQTWSAPAIAVHNLYPSGGITDKDWLQVDDSSSSPYANAVYISITQFDASNDTEITVTHSDNGGSTWTTKVVDTLQTYPTIDQFSDLTIGKNGTVYVTWMRCTANGAAGDCGGTTATFYISSSTDGGNTWSTPVALATANLAPDACFCAFYGSLPNTNERVSDIPAVGVNNVSTSPYFNHLAVVFYTWTGTYMKVEAVHSANGSKWSAPVALAPSSDTHDQFFAWLSDSPKSGAIGVTWLDRRNDPNNLEYEEFGTYSISGGKTYHANIQIANTPSNPDNDGFGGGFMGDYTGNVWAGKHLYASWMDTRNGTDCQDFVGGILK
jgi:hypothetical protein